MSEDKKKKEIVAPKLPRGERTVSFGNKNVAEDDRQSLVQGVFTSVASRYDLMNDLMSFGTHRLWKRFLLTKTGLKEGGTALDVAGGTADIALLMADKVGKGGNVTVFDINKEMLEEGRKKCIDRGYVSGMDFVQGNAEEIPFEDNSFDVATVGFGIRNVTRIDRAFKEMTRVVKPGGRVICMEFSKPNVKLFEVAYDAYSYNVIPAVGEVVTGDRDAYEYLIESIRKFPAQEKLKEIMTDAGLFNVKYYNILTGVVAIHVGVKC